MAPAGPVRPGAPLAGRDWPAVPSRAGFLLAALTLLTLLGTAGCGHATAPCPTPPATLDAHRVQSEALQRDLSEASAEIESLENRREEALGRIQAASETEDSLSQSRARAKKR